MARQTDSKFTGPPMSSQRQPAGTKGQYPETANPGGGGHGGQEMARLRTEEVGTGEGGERRSRHPERKTGPKVRSGTQDPVLIWVPGTWWRS